MRELDELLGAWLDRRYVNASEVEKAAFCDLLALPDPELASCLLGGQEPADPVIAQVAGQIRKQT